VLLPLLTSALRPQLAIAIVCELSSRISALVLAWLIGEIIEYDTPL
jgi:hypothetical protein